MKPPFFDEPPIGGKPENEQNGENSLSFPRQAAETGPSYRVTTISPKTGSFLKRLAEKLWNGLF